MTLAFLLASVLFALMVSATCSLLEAALLSLTPGQVADLKRRRPVAGAIWERFKQNVERPISVILICNTAAHTIGATVAGAEFEQLMSERYDAGGWAVLVFGVVFTFLMLQFTEILPKTLGVKYNTTVATIAGRPLAWLVRVLEPVLWLVHAINRPFEGRQKVSEASREALDEINTLASAARVGEVINKQQERMIRTAGQLPTISVKQIMTHRKDVHYLRLDMTPGEILRTVRKTPYSRLPVVDGDMDKVVGIVHLRDLLNHLALVPGRLNVAPDPERPEEVIAIPTGKPGSELHVIGSGEIDLRAILREPLIVMETQTADGLLRLFQDGKSHLAVVVDEYGSTRGIVTLEDVLEEIVGNIRDEFDLADTEHWLTPNEQGAWHVSGQVTLRELEESLELDADEERAHDVVTLNGYVIRELGRFPQAGDEVELEAWTIRVEATEAGQVRRASVYRHEPAEASR